MASNLDRYRDYPTVTRLSNTSQWSGTMRFKTSLRIDGEYEGKIDAQGLLVIGPDAKIKGDLTADEIIIGGEIHGNVHARKRLELFNTAKLYGDIKTPKLKMEDGVVFQGKCEMLPSA